MSSCATWVQQQNLMPRTVTKQQHNKFEVNIAFILSKLEMCTTIVFFVFQLFRIPSICYNLFQISAKKVNEIGGRNEIPHS